MAEAYPIELRERVVKAYESGDGSYAGVAVAFALGEATVKRWVWLSRETGELLPRPKGGGNFSTITQADVESMLQRLGDATAGELAVEFNRDRRGAARVHVSSMKRALHRCGYVVKKNAAGRWKLSVPMSSRSAKRSQRSSTPSP
jgi:transposase